VNHTNEGVEEGPEKGLTHEHKKEEITTASAVKKERKDVLWNLQGYREEKRLPYSPRPQELTATRKANRAEGETQGSAKGREYARGQEGWRDADQEKKRIQREELLKHVRATLLGVKMVKKAEILWTRGT